MARAFLRVLSGSKQGMSVLLREDQALLVGRIHGDLKLDDALISSTHCQIIYRNGRYVLQDLGSTNGSLVDGKHIGQHVAEAALRPGVEIVLGSTRLILFASEEPERVEKSDDGSKVAWLLDDELVARAADEPETAVDLIGQSLRLPPRLEGRGRVEVIAGPDTGKTFRFTRGSVVIGRRQGEVPLSDAEISRKHAYIEVFGADMIFLRDVASTNGTYHNGRRVSVARLQEGDTIGCGKSVMRLFVS